MPGSTMPLVDQKATTKTNPIPRMPSVSGFQPGIIRAGGRYTKLVVVLASAKHPGT